MKLSLDELNRMMDENSGNLNLNNSCITSLPAGLTVAGSLYLNNSGITSLPEGLTVGRNLFMSHTGITFLPKNLTVGGNLDLSHTCIISLPEGLAVDGNLFLSNTGITFLPEGLTIGGSLNLNHTGIMSLPENLTVGRNLSLSYTGIKFLPDGLTIGGNLDLYNTGIATLPEGLTIGGNLFLCGTGITSIPESLAVGKDIDLSYTKIPSAELGKVRYLRDGDYVPGKYLFAYGILTHVKRTMHAGPYTVYVGKIPHLNAVSNGIYYVHCDRIRDGIAELRFKAAKDRGAEQYHGLSLDASFTEEDAVSMYRIITGACRQGSQVFVENLGSRRKDSYTVRECVDLTRGQYGANRFAAFFGL